MRLSPMCLFSNVQMSICDLIRCHLCVLDTSAHPEAGQLVWPGHWAQAGEPQGGCLG